MDIHPFKFYIDLLKDFLQLNLGFGFELKNSHSSSSIFLLWLIPEVFLSSKTS